MTCHILYKLGISLLVKPVLNNDAGAKFACGPDEQGALPERSAGADGIGPRKG